MSAVEVAVLMYGIPIVPTSEFFARCRSFLGEVKFLDSDPDLSLLEMFKNDLQDENGVSLELHGDYYDCPQFFIGIKETKKEGALGYSRRIYQHEIKDDYHLDAYDRAISKFLNKYDYNKELILENIGRHIFAFMF